MEAALAAIRRVFAEEDVTETTLASAKRRTSGERTRTRPDAELLSAEATVAIGSAINTLRETVKKQEPTIEEVVREALHPMLNSTKTYRVWSSEWCAEKSSGLFAGANHPQSLDPILDPISPSLSGITKHCAILRDAT
jgi:hypothetical protein